MMTTEYRILTIIINFSKELRLQLKRLYFKCEYILENEIFTHPFLKTTQVVFVHRADN